MKKKTIVFVICAILVIILLGILLFNKDKKTDDTEMSDNYLPIYNKEVIGAVENTTLQGVVELNHNGYIYIFNGQHFGEYGFEMEEYTRANINNKKQECIDYYTSEKYDTSYIQEGDILFCTGDTIKYSMGESDFDTKDNSIIVLKSGDYNKIKKEAITGRIPTVITVGAFYTDHIYLKYDITDNDYQLPFALKFDVTDKMKIIGTIENGKKIKAQYKNINVPIDELELESIEVIEN